MRESFEQFSHRILSHGVRVSFLALDSLATTDSTWYESEAEKAEAAERMGHVRELSARVSEGIKTLKPNERIAVIMRYKQECSIAEIATVLNVDRSNAHRTARRGLDKLKAYIEDRPAPSM